jgi:hypothetical protein
MAGIASPWATSRRRTQRLHPHRADGAAVPRRPGVALRLSTVIDCTRHDRLPGPRRRPGGGPLHVQHQRLRRLHQPSTSGWRRLWRPRDFPTSARPSLMTSGTFGSRPHLATPHVAAAQTCSGHFGRHSRGEIPPTS